MRSLLALAGMLAAMAPVRASDFSAACEAYGMSDVVFVGRAQAPVKRTLSWDFGVEKLTRDFKRAEAALEKYKASVPESQRGETEERDLVIAMIRADEARDMAVAMTTPPIELTLTPMVVEAAFRGVTTSMVWVDVHGEPLLEPGRSYLVYGENPHVFSEVVAPSRLPIDVESAQDDLLFLNSAAAVGTTIYGKLELESAQSGSSPLSGVTLSISSAGSVFKAITKEDGSFSVSGVPAGRVEIEPSLPDRLTIGGAYSGVRVVRDGGCFPWTLRAVPNGRVRGRVLRAGGSPLAHSLVDLILTDSHRSPSGNRRSFVLTNEYGEFEFSGQPPGAYWLGINLSKTQGPVGPYPPTYFPGTTDPDAAEPIVIGDGTEQGGLNFLVTPRAEPAIATPGPASP